MADDPDKPDSRAVTVHQSAIPAGEMHREVMNFIGNAVADPNTDVQKLRALLDMGREVRAENAQALFNEAMFRVQAELQPMVRSRRVDLVDKDGKSKGHYNFLPLEDIDEDVRPLLVKNNMWQTFTTEPRADGGLMMTSIVGHTAGHTQTAKLGLPLDTGPGRNNLQAYGSTASYLRRYLTEMQFNIVRKRGDDDGQAGGTRFIEQPQADELRVLCKQAGRTEAAFLARMFGDAVRSFEELEVGTGYMAVRSTLDGIIQNRKKTKPEG